MIRCRWVAFSVIEILLLAIVPLTDLSSEFLKRLFARIQEGDFDDITERFVSADCCAVLPAPFPDTEAEALSLSLLLSS